MPDLSLKNRTNIFGQITSSSGPNFGTFVPNSADSDAVQMIEYLKWNADQQLAYLQAAADWMGIAANQGQNGSEGLINTAHMPPADIELSEVNTGPTMAQFPTLPQFPAIPDGLKVDSASIVSSTEGSLNDLKNTWLYTYFPSSATDLTRIDTLFRGVLDGSDYSLSVAKLNELETELKSALNNIATEIKNSMATSIAALDSKVNTRTAALDSKVTSSLAIATNNTQNVAWSRARDQAVAEGLRQESEVLTLWASRGFTLPPGLLAAHVLAAGQTTSNASVTAAAEQAVRSQQLYFDVAQKSVDSWTATTQLIINADIENYKNQYMQRLAVAQLQSEQDRAKVKQAFDHLGLTLDFSKFSADLAVKYRLGVEDALNGLINAYANLMRNYQLFATEAAAAQQRAIMAIVDYYRAAIQGADFSLKAKGLNIDNDLKFAQISAEFIANSVRNHVQAASATGDMYARAAAMALNGMTGIASTSASV